MISEEQQEQAALYALGLLDANEVQAFRRAMAADAELRALAVELRDAAASVALAAEPEIAQPSAGLKTRVLAAVTREAAFMAPVPAPMPSINHPAVRKSRAALVWLPWALAAAACVVASLSLWDHNALLKERDRAYSLWRETRALRDHEAIARGIADEARDAASPLRLVSVCQLEPTPNGPPQPRVAVVWDPAHRQGELIVVQLRPPTESHDYQLWVVEEGHKEPVSAGVVHVDGEGRAKAEFKPAGDGDEKVNAFALSLEQAGGSATNKGPILLLGKL